MLPPRPCRLGPKEALRSGMVLLTPEGAPEEFRDVPLRRNEGAPVNGQPSWSAADGRELHLYRQVCAAEGWDNWVLSNEITPDGSASLASVSAGAGGLPPAGAATWRLSKAVRGAAGGKKWADGELTLVLGAAEQAPPEARPAAAAPR